MCTQSNKMAQCMTAVNFSTTTAAFHGFHDNENPTQSKLTKGEILLKV
jgi:hypothetical protein